MNFSIDNYIQKIEREKLISPDVQSLSVDLIPEEHKRLARLINNSYKHPSLRKEQVAFYEYYPEFSNEDLTVWTKDKTVVIAYKGTTTPEDILFDFKFATNTLKKGEIERILEKVKYIYNSFSGYSPYIVGHSLGGTKAIIVSRYLGVPGIAFNPFIPTLNNETLDILYKSGNILKYTIYGDILSNKLIELKDIPNVQLLQSPGLVAQQKHALTNFLPTYD